MNEIKRNKAKKMRRQSPKLTVPQTTLENLENIIEGFYKLRVSSEISTVGEKVYPDKPKETAKNKVSLALSFLRDIGILGGQKGDILSSLTKTGKTLGHKIQFESETDKINYWQLIIRSNRVCVNLVNHIFDKGDVTREEFQKALYSTAGYSDIPKNIFTGANALIELLCKTGFVRPMQHTKAKSKKDKFNVSQKIQYSNLDSIADNEKNVFIPAKRINELKNIKNSEFDLTRLIKYCEEINSNYPDNIFSVIFLCRAILDHCPPIFNEENFKSVIAHIDKSAKSELTPLSEILKGKADYQIHKQIKKGKREVIPIPEDIDFSDKMNTLIARIIENI